MFRSYDHVLWPKGRRKSKSGVRGRGPASGAGPPPASQTRSGFEESKSRGGRPHRSRLRGREVTRQSSRPPVRADPAHLPMPPSVPHTNIALVPTVCDTRLLRRAGASYTPVPPVRHRPSLGTITRSPAAPARRPRHTRPVRQRSRAPAGSESPNYTPSTRARCASGGECRWLGAHGQHSGAGGTPRGSFGKCL